MNDLSFHKLFKIINLKKFLVKILKGKTWLDALKKWNEIGGILITTIQRLWNLINSETWTYFQTIVIHSLVIDEAHNVVSTENGNAMKVINCILKQCQRRLFLTGTPFVGNGTMFGKLLNILAPNIQLNSLVYKLFFWFAFHFF